MSRSPQAGTMTSSAGNSPRRPMDRNMEPSLSIEEDRASVNSFKTCPSETNLSYLPRQVTDTYATSGGGGAAATFPAARKESAASRKESAASRRKDSSASSTATAAAAAAAAAGAKNSHSSSLNPKTSILRTGGAYAAEPRIISPSSEGPPRSPSGVPLPQLVERPPSQNEFSYGSLMQQGPGISEMECVIASVLGSRQANMSQLPTPIGHSQMMPICVACLLLNGRFLGFLYIFGISNANFNQL